MTTKLFEPVSVGSLKLKNRIAMAPMTRCRAGQDHELTPIMIKYYADRADAGLIISEGTAPSPHGAGYARIPGLYRASQVRDWKKVTDAVHARGGTIVAQLMHTGRASVQYNLPPGARVLAPSAIGLTGTLWTDSHQLQPYPVPHAMTAGEIEMTLGEFTSAAVNAIEAGFDGVEIHGANGYLIDQFFNTASNQRTDGWGGTIEGRMRFPLEVARRITGKIGSGRTGIRISPHAVFNDMKPDAEMDTMYERLMDELNAIGLMYVHVVDHSSMGAPEVSPVLKAVIRKKFKGAYVLSGGYDRKRADEDLAAGRGDLVAFGRPFLSNPDLVSKLKTGAPLRPSDPNTFYTPGEPGYNDYATAS